MDFRRYVREHLPPLTIAREPEIVDELALHLGELYREARASGLDHDEALARALAAIPTASNDFAHDLESASRALPGLIADRWRAQDDTLLHADSSRSGSMVADLRRDTRYAVRMLARTPAFTFVICLTLALGIGATAVIFSAVDAVLLQRAPVADPSSVISIYTTSSDGRDRFSTTSYPDYVDLRDSGIFGGLAAFASVPFVLQGSNGAESLPGELVTGNYFDVLGVRIPLGRTFSADEDKPGAPIRVVILSHGAWTARFGADRNIVGRQITLNGNSYSIVGVAPRGFVGPILGRAPEMWAPMALQPELRPPSAGLRRALGGTNMLAARGPTVAEHDRTSGRRQDRCRHGRGRGHALGAAGRELPEYQSRPAVHRRPSRRWSRRPHVGATDAAAAQRLRRCRAADRVRERCESPPGTRRHTTPRGGRPHGRGRRPRAARQAVADRIGAARADRDRSEAC